MLAPQSRFFVRLLQTRGSLCRLHCQQSQAFAAGTCLIVLVVGTLRFLLRRPTLQMLEMFRH